MSNQAALETLLRWWRSVPSFRRPGRDGHFSLTPANVEHYVLDLREHWARCGVGVLNLCRPYRESLERQARLTIQDVQYWLGLVESSVPPKISKLATFIAWLARWGGKLTELKNVPLAHPPGDTLGNSLSSQLLAEFRWWSDPAETKASPRGPLDDFLKSVARGDKALPDAVLAAMDAFPESVTELHHAVAKSPWPAAYLLNWLLSDKGVLRPSRRSPAFDGPLAVPDARAWLDQLAPTFHDWLISRFVEPKTRKPKLRCNAGKLIPDDSGFLSPSGDAAISQLVCPVIPSAYIVPLNADPLDVRKLYPGASHMLGAAEGQCAVFDFLLSRLEQLERREFGVDDELDGPPMLYVVDGEGRRPVALQIGTSAVTRPLKLGAANLLYTLGKRGYAVEVLYEYITDLRQSLGRLQRFLDVGKKTGNRSSKNYARCDGRKFQGMVEWPATKENAPAI